MSKVFTALVILCIVGGCVFLIEDLLTEFNKPAATRCN